MKNEAQQSLKLPASLISPTDVARLIRELEQVENEFEQQKVHSPGASLVVPNLTRGLASLCQDNAIDIANDEARSALRAQMITIKNSAPVLHMTFASDAEPDVVSELTTWIRDKLHPLALITTGVQPNLVGGCVIRTPDHIYDFSLRERFHSHRSSFVEALQGALAKTPYIPEPEAPQSKSELEAIAAGGNHGQ